MNIVVWFSCGAASAVAIQETIAQYPGANVRVVNNPIAEEDDDNQRFLHDVERWLGVTVEYAVNPKWEACSVEEVWDKRGFMAAPHGAPCTVELKKAARQRWEETNDVDFHVLGFTVDEYKRYTRFIQTERSNVLPVLVDALVTKGECFNRVMQAGIELPRMYRAGYPNANCPGCVKATSPTYWNHVREVDPEVFASRAVQSRRLGARLARHKGERVFLDELPADAVGRPMKTMQIECGIFCEEPE